jgi:hypothetical protein
MLKRVCDLCENPIPEPFVAIGSLLFASCNAGQDWNLVHLCYDCCNRIHIVLNNLRNDTEHVYAKEERYAKAK